MALALTRTLFSVLSAQTIGNGATVTSSEQDLGDDSIAHQVWLHWSVTGYATTPAGNKRMIIKIAGSPGTGETKATDFCPSYVFTTDADQAYTGMVAVASLPRFFVVTATNDTSQTTDSSGFFCTVEAVVETV
jgi:hypothetical protein